MAKVEAFNPADLSEEALNKLAVPPADKNRGTREVARPIRAMTLQESEKLARGQQVDIKPLPASLGDVAAANDDDLLDDPALRAPLDYAIAKQTPRAERAGNPTPDPVNSQPGYLNNRIRITFELDSGEYSLPAIDVVRCRYGFMVILPAGASDVGFTPKPGAKLTLRWDDEAHACYCPGTAFDIPQLRIKTVVLIAEEDLA